MKRLKTTVLLYSVSPILVLGLLALVIMAFVSFRTPLARAQPNDAPPESMLQCVGPAENPAGAPFLSAFPSLIQVPSNPAMAGPGYQQFEIGPGALPNTLAKTSVRIRVPRSSNQTSVLMPFELCSLTNPGACPRGKSDVSQGQADAIRRAKPKIVELLRFEVVEVAGLSQGEQKLLERGRLPGARVQTKFAQPIEVWAEVGAQRLAAAAQASKAAGAPLSDLAVDVPAFGYWSCGAKKLYQWQAFTPAKHDLRLVIEREDGATVEIRLKGKEPAPADAVVVAGGDILGAAAQVSERLKALPASGASNPGPIPVLVVQGATFSARSFIAGLEGFGVLKAGDGSLGYRMFLAVTVDQWNDPGLGMQP